MNPAAATDLASLLASIHNLYPQAKVTSGYRGPDNPLTRANPRSMHAMGSPEDPRAVDIAPIPGMDFNQYVGGLRKAGVPVAQAFDEAKHPFPWTTGPNWHVAEGQPQGAAPKMPAPMPQKQATPTLASLVNQPAPVDAMGPLVPQQAQSLGELAGNMPQVAPKKGPLGLSKNQWAAMLAALSDAGYRMSGVQSNNLGAFQQGQQHDQDQQFDRERWAQQLEEKRQEAMAPPQFAQNAMWFQQQPPEVKAQILQSMDQTNPILTATPQGTQLNKRYNGPPPEAVNELRAAAAKGDQSAVSEFEEVFGPGSSRAYLAQ